MLPRSDYFEESTLNLCWHFLNRTAARKYSLTEKQGWLSLDPGTGKTHILQKEAGHYYALVTRVCLDAQNDGQEAGIYLTNGNESVIVTLATGYAGGRKIMFDFGTASYETDNELGDTVWLKLERTRHELRAYYGSDGIDWNQAGGKINVSSLDQNQPNFNSWVGTSIGLFASGKKADFDLFLYRDGFSKQLAEGYNNACGITKTSKSPGTVAYNTTAEGGWLMLGGTDLGRGERIPVGIEVKASSAKGGTLEIWLDDIEHGGTKIATIPVTNTGNDNTFKTFSAEVSGVSGQHDVFLRFIGDKNAMFVYSIRFVPQPASTEGIGSKKGNDSDPFRVYPNPSDGVFHVDCNEEAVDYTIYNLAGKKVEHSELRTGNCELGKALLPGMYFLEVNTEQSSATIRIVKSGMSR